jgi:hypothetical protein
MGKELLKLCYTKYLYAGPRAVLNCEALKVAAIVPEFSIEL